MNFLARNFTAGVGLVLITLVQVGGSGLATADEDPPNGGVLNVQTKDRQEFDCALATPAWVLWRAPIGTRSGAPVIAGDRILIGTNNEKRDGAAGGDNMDLGVLKCFHLQDGKFLWQTTHNRYGGRKTDLPRSPIMSRPTVDGKNAYYVSNRGELVCVSMETGGIIWMLDMVSDLGIYKVEAPDIGNPTSGTLVVDDLVYCVTGNGGDFEGVPAPDAPSFIAVNKLTGKLAWSSNAPGRNIVYGQWASPVAAVVGGTKQIIFPGGDGYLYGFEPKAGKLLWKIDLGGNVPAGDPHLRGLGRRNFFVGSPALDGDTVYVGLAQIPEDISMETRRPVYAVELAVRGGTTVPRIKWTFDNKNFNGTTASVAVSDGKVYVVSQSGVVFGIDAASGRTLWTSDLGEQAAFFSNPCVQGGHLYVATGDADLYVFSLGPVPKCQCSIYFDGGIQFTSPLAVEGRLYLGADGYLWALQPPLR